MVTQKDVGFDRQCEFLMPCHFTPTVPSQGAIQLFEQLARLLDQRLDDAVAVLVANLGHHHETRLPFDQSWNEAVASPCD